MWRPGESVDDLVGRADKALYEAKEAGGTGSSLLVRERRQGDPFSHEQRGGSFRGRPTRSRAWDDAAWLMKSFDAGFAPRGVILS